MKDTKIHLSHTAHQEAIKRIEKAIKQKAVLLDLSNLSLTSIPKEMEDLPYIFYLKLQNNQLTQINHLQKLRYLIELDLSQNKLTETKGLRKLSRLRYLNLGHNRLIEINGLKKMNELKELHLNNNKLTTVKGEQGFIFRNVLHNLTGINWCRKLLQINLSNNELTSIEGLEKFGNPININLSNNPHITVEDLNILAHRKGLQLNFNKGKQIIQLHKSLNQNVPIINYTPPPQLENKVLKRIRLYKRDNSPELDLSGLKLTSVPDEIKEMTNLKMLTLSNNALEETNGLEKFTNLTKLNLRNNKIKTIPIELAQLTQLKDLDLSENPLAESEKNKIKWLFPDLYRLRY